MSTFSSWPYLAYPSSETRGTALFTVLKIVPISGRAIDVSWSLVQLLVQSIPLAVMPIVSFVFPIFCIRVIAERSQDWRYY